MRPMIVKTHSTIRNILLILVIIIVALFLFLKEGISINNLKLGSFHIEKLYLKLDKKLIIKAKRLIIPQFKKRDRVPNLEKSLNKVKSTLRYFQSIELQEVQFKGNHYTIYYADKIFYMQTDEIEVAAKDVDYIDDKLHATFDLIYIKKFDIRLSAKVIYDIKDNSVMIRGQAHYLDINSDFIINKKQDRLYYALNSHEFTQLKPLIDQFSIPPKISVWITDNVKAKKYKLTELKGILQVDENGVKVLPKTIAGRAILKDVDIKFQKNLDVVKASEVAVSFNDGNLTFDMKDPKYKEKILDGSRLSIVNLIKKPSLLQLDLKLHTAFDKDIKEILESYKIKVPIIQTRGLSQADIQLSVALKAKKVIFSGDIVAEDSVVEINKVKLPIKKGKIHIEGGEIKLSDVLLSSKWYESFVDGTIYLKKKRVKLKANINRVALGDGSKKYFVMKKSKQDITIDYDKTLSINLPKLQSSIMVSNKSRNTNITIKDLNLIKPYLSSLPFSINGGNLTIDTKDFVTYKFSGLLSRDDCYLYKDSATCITRIPISGTVAKDGLLLNVLNKKLEYSSYLSQITLNNINFDLKKFFEDKTTKLGSDTSTNGLKNRLKIVANNSIIRHGKNQLLTDKYILDIDANKNFVFTASLNKDRVKVVKDTDYLTVKADNITDKMLHPLINFNGLKGGIYSINTYRNREKVTKGTIIIKGGVMRDFKTYNNLIALINTIPSLATLNAPGFSSKGFKIKKGTIEFTLTDEQLTFDSVFIEGSSSSISGSGVINLKSKVIKVDLAILTAREAGKLIGSLPVVGYILMGENKSMTVGLQVTGTLDNPKVQTNPVKDVLLIPFKILLRTMSTPNHIQKKVTKEKQTPKKVLQKKELDMY